MKICGTMFACLFYILFATESSSQRTESRTAWAPCDPAYLCYKRRVVECTTDGVTTIGLRCTTPNDIFNFEQIAQIGCDDACIANNRWINTRRATTCRGDCYDSSFVEQSTCATNSNCHLRSTFRCYNEDSCSGTWTTPEPSNCSGPCGGGTRVLYSFCRNATGAMSYHCNGTGGDISATSQPGSTQGDRRVRLVIEPCNVESCLNSTTSPCSTEPCITSSRNNQSYVIPTEATNSQTGQGLVPIVAPVVGIVVLIIIILGIIYVLKKKQQRKEEPNETNNVSVSTYIDMDQINDKQPEIQLSHQTTDLSPSTPKNTESQNAVAAIYSTPRLENKRIKKEIPSPQKSKDATGSALYSIPNLNQKRIRKERSPPQKTNSDKSNNSYSDAYASPKNTHQSLFPTKTTDNMQGELTKQNDYTSNPMPRNSIQSFHEYDTLHANKGSKEPQDQNNFKNNSDMVGDYDQLRATNKKAVLGQGEVQSVYNVAEKSPPVFNEYSHLQIPKKDGEANLRSELSLPNGDDVGYTHMRSLAGSMTGQPMGGLIQSASETDSCWTSDSWSDKNTLGSSNRKETVRAKRSVKKSRKVRDQTSKNSKK